MSKHMYYPSNVVGSFIVNAETGIYYKDCKVGSIEEKKFFRVIDSTGTHNNGLKVSGNYSNKLFYDNYEQYYKHRLNNYKED